MIVAGIVVVGVALVGLLASIAFNWLSGQRAFVSMGVVLAAILGVAAMALVAAALVSRVLVD
jgi:hypothetical protein